MSYKKTRNDLAKQSFEISMSASEVITRRVTGMVFAGFNPSASQKKENRLMWSEKSDAMAESWLAMMLQISKSQQEMYASTIQAMFTPWWNRKSLSLMTPKQYNAEALKVINKGLKPIHKKATSNAKRLKNK